MYRKAANGWLKHIDFLIIDMLCLEFSYLIAYCIRNGFNNPWEKTVYRSMFMVLLLTDFVMVAYFGTLKNVLKRGYYCEFVTTLRHVCMVMLFATFFLFITQMGRDHSRLVLILMGVQYFLVSCVLRVLWKRYLLTKDVLSKGKHSLLIITTENGIERVVSEIKKNNYGRFQVTGLAVIDRDMTGETVDGVPIVADLNMVVEYVCREWIDEVFIKLTHEVDVREELVKQFIEMGVTVHEKLMRTGVLTGQKQLVERIGSYMVLTTSINMTTPEASLVKRLLDICGGVIGCIITGGLFLVFAPAIYIKSPGPVFFSQIRVGQNGKKFKLYKFRSMYLDAEERKKELMENNRVDNGMMFKLDYDPRIIGSEKGDGKGIGNFIRKYSIDEFPQFWNVLKGDMSLVGTRPPTVDEWEKYALHHRARLAIKPGITGLWQVSGRSSITDFEEVVKLDTSYISAWSMGLDLRILLKTVMVVLGQSGAL